jgi:FtsP/CotA-like multicopper oxidase with cupredoxin domain
VKARGIVVNVQFNLAGRSARRLLQIAFLFSIFSLAHLSSRAQTTQHIHPGRGAISAQDLAKLAALPLSSLAASAAPDPADQVCPRYPAGSATTAPPELESQNGVLEVTFKFLTATDAQGLPRYCYITDTGLQAPTLRVNPGDHLIIHFQNDLPASLAPTPGANMAGMKMSLSSDDAAASTSSACNGTMSVAASNIHFHGTNTAPVCGQDEVVHTLVAPGQTFDYNVQIPQNEPPGLYWYHPHPHGFSEGQVQGGATGALIVEGLQNVDTALAGLTERTFVVRDQVLPASEANDPDIPAWDISINYVPVTYPNYTPAVIQTNPGQQELWRVVNSAADTILDLQYVVNGTPQIMQVAAIDGYPIASGSSGQTSENETSILLPPGARAEFVITTPKVGDQAQLTTQYWNTGPDGDFDPTRTIANIVSQNGIETSSSAVAARHLPSHAVRAKVTRFAALAAATPVAQRNFAFSEVLQDPTNPNSPTNFFITEQGQQPTLFDMNNPPAIVVHAGTVEDWVVENTALEDHIFHIHQIHFQVLEVNGQPVNDPAIRDTVDLPYWSGSGPYPSVKVRMDFRDPNIVGTFIYHCHILQHEDAGMMAAIQVLPTSGLASAVTATASASSFNPNANVTLTAKVVDAATGSPAPTGTVQFELNGVNVGNPVTVANGQATVTTPVNGDAGSGNITAFYEGDATYAESVSAGIPVTISNFALSSPGVTAPLGSAAIAPVTVDVANNYTNLISFTCTMPSTLTEAACFVDPNSTSGTGKVSLTVNTTPVHPASRKQTGLSAWLAAGGSASFACIFLFALPRRRWRGAMLLLALTATLFTFTVVGCSSGGGGQTDPGTPKGTYTVVVTALAGSGSSQSQATVNVPVTIQ